MKRKERIGDDGKSSFSAAPQFLFSATIRFSHTLLMVWNDGSELPVDGSYAIGISGAVHH